MSDDTPAPSAPSTNTSNKKTLLLAAGCGLLLLGGVAAGVAALLNRRTPLDEALYAVFDKGWKFYEPEQQRIFLANVDDPRVQREFAQHIQGYPFALEHVERDRERLEVFGAYFTKRPPEPNDHLIRLVTRAVVVTEYEPAKAWLADYATNAKVGGEVVKLLDDLAEANDADRLVRLSAERRAALVERALAELKARKVPEQAFAPPLIRLSILVDVPAAKPFVTRHPELVAEGCAELLNHSNVIWEPKRAKGLAGLFAQLKALKPKQISDALLDAWIDNYRRARSHSRRGDVKFEESESERCLALLQAKGPEVARRVRDRVERIEKRGHKLSGIYLAARLGATRPEDAKELLGPLRPRAKVLYGAREDAYVAALVALGPPARGAVKQALAKAKTKQERRALERALTALDPVGFARQMLDRLRAYAPLAWRLLIKKEQPTPALREEFERLQKACVSGLRALATAKGHQVDFAFFAALASPDGGIQQMGSATLRQRLAAPAFADALFRFLATRPKFKVSEVELYEDALTSYPGVAPEIARNLSRELKQAGKPERVSWVHKVIALRALAKVGTADCRAVLERYAQDTDEFALTSSVNGQETSREVVKFADLAQKALKALPAR